MGKELTIRLFSIDGEGVWQDEQHDYELENFGGHLPAVGDIILEEGVLSGLDRNDPKNRRLMTVKHRVFNAGDNPDYIALVVDKNAPTKAQAAIC